VGRHCPACRKWLGNKQAVRAHLRWCEKWKDGGLSALPELPETRILVCLDCRSVSPLTLRTQGCPYCRGDRFLDTTLPPPWYVCARCGTPLPFNAVTLPCSKGCSSEFGTDRDLADQRLRPLGPLFRAFSKAPPQWKRLMPKRVQ